MSVYTDDRLLNCNDLCNYDSENPKTFDCYTEQEISERLTIFPVDDVIILILGTVGLISSLFVIYTFIKFKETRKQPGDIILAISISEFILLCHWMSMVIYNIYWGVGPLNNSAFCQTEAFFSISAGTSEFVYNCLFCLYIIFQVRNTLLQASIPKIWFHISAVIIMIGVILYCEITKSTGLSLFGMCSFKQQSNFSMFGVLLVVIYLILSCITIWYFKSKVPDNQIFAKYRKEFLGYYTTYVIMQTCIWFVLAIANLLVGLNCTTIHQPGLNFFVTVGNTSKLLTSICLSIIRYKDPNIRKIIRPILERKIPCIFKPSQSFSNSEKPLLDDDNSENPSDIRIKQTTGNFFDELYKKLRISEIYTMIAGVVALQKLSPQNPTLSLQEISQKDCQDQYSVTLTQELIQQFPSVILQDNKKKYDSLIDDNTKVTMYAPKLFKTLIEIDRKMVNLDVSFNINDNIRDISLQFGGTDGGRGGAFFYLTNDIKMMMKSMNKDELDIILKSLYQYKEHFVQNPNSLISKIYGLFTFKKGDKTEHILLMRNIQCCPKQYKLRTYDLKGSTVDRSVLKKFTDPIKRKEAISKKTLKDQDFAEVEKNGRIHIEEKLAEQVSEILTKDAQFFNKIEVMDYSLLIIKINWAQFSIDAGESEDYLANYLFNNSLYSIPSTMEPGVRYHMAIIDYLQIWNLQKQSEQKAKQFKQGDIKLDISAQEPKVYCNRFIENIAKYLFLGGEKKNFM